MAAIASLGLALSALAALLAPAPGARADDPPQVNAIFNGQAVAWGAFVPMEVNPNAELYPAYSFSEIDRDTSHGIAAGFYPGFLVDAAAQFYGYGPEARSSLGIAESQWPNPPQEASAAFTDFGDKCRFTASDALFPEAFVGYCQTYWEQYPAQFNPIGGLAGRTTSGPYWTSNEAFGSNLTLPSGVTIGSIHTVSSTSARDGKRVVSDASAILSDIKIGTTLRIRQIRSVAHAESNGTGAGARKTSSFTILDPVADGVPIGIDDTGLRAVQDNDAFKQAAAKLAEEGFTVRTLGGSQGYSQGVATSDVGGLAIGWHGRGQRAELVGPTSTTCGGIDSVQSKEADALQAATGSRDPQHIATSTPNPLYATTKPRHLLPKTFDVDQPVPPPVSCPLLLLDREINLGVTIGTASTSARYVSLPPPPTFNFGNGPGVPTLPPPPPPPAIGPGPSVTPPAPAAPPPPGVVLYARGVLDAAVARRVATVYAAIVALFGIMLIARNSFRRYVRS